MRFVQPKHSLSIAKWFINGILSHKINNIGKSVGFIKRNDGKLLPSTFVKAFTLGTLNISNPTLQLVANICEDLQDGLTLSKVAIYQRLGVGSELLKEVLKECLSYAISFSSKACAVDILKQFSDVDIFDSTIVSLPQKLAAFYPGSGGRHKAGSLCIQTMFSLLDRCFKHIELTGNYTNDGSYTKEIPKKMKQGGLAIFDRGYKNKSGHKDIMDKGAFFLTRIVRNSIFYSADMKYRYPNKELDIVDILKKSNGFVDMELQMGSDPQRRIKCRLVAIQLPPEIANERIRKARKSVGKKTLSNKELELLKWDTFATNVPSQMLPAETVGNIYRLRWQIEILFKACKSHLGLENLRGCGKEQMECLVYGRLIMAVLMSIFYSQCYAAMYKKLQREVSVLKFFSYIKNHAYEFMFYILGYQLSYNKLGQLLEKAALASLYEKRKRKTSLANIIQYHISHLESSA